MKYVRKAISLLQISTPSATAATTTMQRQGCIMYPVVIMIRKHIDGLMRIDMFQQGKAYWEQTCLLIAGVTR